MANRELKQVSNANSEVMITFDENGTKRQKRIPLSCLAAFILNSVNQPRLSGLLEEADAS